MAQDPRSAATAYLKKHSVNELFESLGTKLMYDKPADVNAYLLEVLQGIKAGKSEGFFTDKDLNTLFSIFDPTSSGSISSAQYLTALESIGITNPFNKFTGERVNREKFVKEAKVELATPKE